ncbi:MAG: Na/Pi cotransporter family protein [Bacteroidales bacterium]|nr:Na/Pi cotransporter family protein [Bacteroidales bacterium]MBR5862589.1 Na/Pi cotransporter family protein [Bacteroidales bacterium]
MTTILNVLSVLGGLAMFLYGMALMSEGLQKSAGDRLRAFMAKMTSNAFKRVLTGTVVTCLVQSSSATTIMVVSFVNAGLLTLGNAIGVIMGANIGTTLTAWITSLGFSVNIALFAVPMMAFGFILHSSKKASLKNVGQFLMGFAVMYVGLTFMKDCSNEILGQYQTGMMNFFGSINGFGFGSIILFLIAGAVLTIVLQASSATMAITMLLAASGLIDFKLAVAMVLGENIGTTITANIAAAVANTSAKRAARAHTIFNIIGVIWVLAVFGPIVKLICVIMEGLDFYNPMAASTHLAAIATGAESADVEMVEMYKNSLLYGIAMLHTLFNVTNTLVLIWFTPLIEKAVVWLVKEPKGETEVYRLKYISGGPLHTAELSLQEAKLELIHFAEICRNGFGYVREAINEQDPQKFDELNDKLIKYEEITDRIEYEIATYLNEVSKNEISQEASDQVKAMYKIIGEMESLGDSGESIGRILKRKNVHSKVFDKTILDRLNKMMDLVQKAYDVMIDNLKQDHLKDIARAENCEYNINECRNHLREEHIVNIESDSYNYLTGVYYMDVLAELEKVGDFLINISQAVVGKHSYEN